MKRRRPTTASNAVLDSGSCSSSSSSSNGDDSSSISSDSSSTSCDSLLKKKTETNPITHASSNKGAAHANSLSKAIRTKNKSHQASMSHSKNKENHSHLSNHNDPIQQPTPMEDEIDDEEGDDDDIIQEIAKQKAAKIPIPATEWITSPSQLVWYRHQQRRDEGDHQDRNNAMKTTQEASADSSWSDAWLLFPSRIVGVTEDLYRRHEHDASSPRWNETTHVLVQALMTYSSPLSSTGFHKHGSLRSNDNHGCRVVARSQLVPYHGGGSDRKEGDDKDITTTTDATRQPSSSSWSRRLWKDYVQQLRLSCSSDSNKKRRASNHKDDDNDCSHTTATTATTTTITPTDIQAGYYYLQRILQLARQQQPETRMSALTKSSGMAAAEEEDDDDDEDDICNLDVPYSLNFSDDEGDYSKYAPPRVLNMATLLERQREPLRPGDVVLYTHPIFVAGDKRGERRAQVFATDPNGHPMIVLSNGDVLPDDTMVARVQIKSGSHGPLLHHPGVFRPIEDFRMQQQVLLNREGNQVDASEGIRRQAKRFRHVMDEGKKELLELANRKRALLLATASPPPLPSSPASSTTSSSSSPPKMSAVSVKPPIAQQQPKVKKVATLGKSKPVSTGQSSPIFNKGLRKAPPLAAAKSNLFKITRVNTAQQRQPPPTNTTTPPTKSARAPVATTVDLTASPTQQRKNEKATRVSAPLMPSSPPTSTSEASVEPPIEQQQLKVKKVALLGKPKPVSTDSSSSIFNKGLRKAPPLAAAKSNEFEITRVNRPSAQQERQLPPPNTTTPPTKSARTPSPTTLGLTASPTQQRENEKKATRVSAPSMPSSPSPMSTSEASVGAPIEQQQFKVKKVAMLGKPKPVSTEQSSSSSIFNKGLRKAPPLAAAKSTEIEITRVNRPSAQQERQLPPINTRTPPTKSARATFATTVGLTASPTQQRKNEKATRVSAPSMPSLPPTSTSEASVEAPVEQQQLKVKKVAMLGKPKSVSTEQSSSSFNEGLRKAPPLAAAKSNEFEITRVNRPSAQQKRQLPPINTRTPPTKSARATFATTVGLTASPTQRRRNEKATCVSAPSMPPSPPRSTSTANGTCTTASSDKSSLVVHHPVVPSHQQSRALAASPPALKLHEYQGTKTDDEHTRPRVSSTPSSSTSSSSSSNSDSSSSNSDSSPSNSDSSSSNSDSSSSNLSSSTSSSSSFDSSNETSTVSDQQKQRGADSAASPPVTSLISSEIHRKQPPDSDKSFGPQLTCDREIIESNEVKTNQSCGTPECSSKHQNNRLPSTGDTDDESASSSSCLEVVMTRGRLPNESGRRSAAASHAETPATSTPPHSSFTTSKAVLTSTRPSILEMLAPPTISNRRTQTMISKASPLSNGLALTKLGSRRDNNKTLPMRTTKADAIPSRAATPNPVGSRQIDAAERPFCRDIDLTNTSSDEDDDENTADHPGAVKSPISNNNTASARTGSSRRHGRRTKPTKPVNNRRKNVDCNAMNVDEEDLFDTDSSPGSSLGSTRRQMPPRSNNTTRKRPNATARYKDDETESPNRRQVRKSNSSSRLSALSSGQLQILEISPRSRRVHDEW